MTRLTATELWNLARVGRPAVSGTTVVVPITRYDIDENDGTTALHLVTDDGLRLLTSDGSSPALSPDGGQLAFLRTVDSRPQLHVMPIDGGEATRVGVEFPLGAGAPKWLPDGSGLVCAAHVYADAPELSETAARRDELASSKVTARTTEERTYRFWDTWLTDDRTLHLFHVSLDDGTTTDLTPKDRFRPHLPTAADPSEQFDIDATGTRIAWAASDLSKDWATRPQTEIWEVSLEGSEPTCLTPESPGDAMFPRWLPDGTVVFGATRELDYYATPIWLTVLDPASGDQRALYEQWDLNPGAWVVDPISGDLLLTAEEQTKVHLYRVPTSGGIPERIVEGSTLTGPVPDGLGAVYLLAQSISQPPEVVRVDATGGTPERVTHVNDEALADLELGPVEERWFTGARGDEVQMYVVYPPGFDESQQWPLVHMVHGGPHNSFGDMWHWRWNYHAFAAAGFVVPLVNFHGSSSFGHEFCECIQGAWGDHPTTDVMAATDLLAAEPWIDEDRMAITGGSYGGYLVTWIGTQTDRFKSIVAHAAVTNQGSMYATDSTHGLARARGADLWVDRAAVDMWSPSHHYEGYVTPTLVIHGERDYRVPVGQGLELYGVLKAKGVDARLVYYPDENHWILSPQNSIHWYDEVLGWLERTLG